MMVTTMSVADLLPEPRRDRRTSAGLRGRVAVPAPVRTVARETLLLGSLLLVYQASRLLGGRDVTAAFHHARTVLHVEQLLRLPGEQAAQALVLSVEPVVRAANSYYAAAHLPVTVAALLWLLLFRPLVYRRLRTAIVGGTAVALAVYLLLPVAPPRMLPGFVDTAATHGQSVYGDAGASALANQYAALPSLHVGWAVLVAIAGVSAAATRWRWLWVLHPVATVAVVVVTGNHYWLDVGAGAALAVCAWLVAGRPAVVLESPAVVVPAQALSPDDARRRSTHGEGF